MTEDNTKTKNLLSRRNAVIGGVSVAGIAVAGTAVYIAGRDTDMGIVTEANAQAKLEDLMQPGAIPEKWTGNKDAAVTIVEYSSLSCPHCANFHKTTLPDLKKKYIDTGKVRYVIRDFPLNNPALAGSMVARCADDSKYFPFLEVLYAKQEQWAFAGQGRVEQELFSLAKQVGFTEASFKKCFQDDKLFKGIMAVRERGANQFGVNSTPTFFINGELLRGAQDFASFEKVIDPILEKAK